MANPRTGSNPSWNEAGTFFIIEWERLRGHLWSDHQKSNRFLLCSGLPAKKWSFSNKVSFSCLGINSVCIHNRMFNGGVCLELEETLLGNYIRNILRVLVESFRLACVANSKRNKGTFSWHSMYTKVWAALFMCAKCIYQQETNMLHLYEKHHLNSKRH